MAVNATWDMVLDVVGGGKAARPSKLVCLDAGILPGFVKAHGHDHESPIIGLVKDVPLTTWLDGAVNPFTRFLDPPDPLDDHLAVAADVADAVEDVPKSQRSSRPSYKRHR